MQLQNKRMVLTLMFFLVIMLGIRFISLGKDLEGPLAVSRMGVFFVGGELTEAPAGSSAKGGGGGATQVVTGQSMVHYLIPAGEQLETPVVMVPGLGLSSSLYLSTPDGRNGWAYHFANAGHPVYVYDNPSLAISGFDINAFNAVRSGETEPSSQPALSIWSTESIWRTWGFGTKKDQPYGETRYPIADIDQLYSSFPPRVASTGGQAPRGEAPASGQTGQRSDGTTGGAEVATAGANTARDGKASGGGRRGGAMGATGPSQDATGLIQVLEKTGPAILLAHSMGGQTAVEVAQLRPDLVKGMILIEPVESPTDPEVVETYLAEKPYLAVYGDYIESRNQTGRLEACQTTARLITEAGGSAEVKILTDQGIKGNTHLMMQDTNNKEIAEQIIGWIASVGIE